MRGISFGKSMEIGNPKALRQMSEKEESKTWEDVVEMFRDKAKEMYANHNLCEMLKGELTQLRKEYGRAEDVPQEVFAKMSEETGYQAELIAALFLRVHEEDMVAKRKRQ